MAEPSGGADQVSDEILNRTSLVSQEGVNFAVAFGLAQELVGDVFDRG